MQITLGNWHPLASHGIFFLLGVAFNSGGPEATPPVKPAYRSGKALLAVAKKLVEHDGSHNLVAGIPVVLTRVTLGAGTSTCRYLPEFSQLVQRHPFPVVELSSGELLNWWEYFVARDKRAFRLIPLSRGAGLPLCSGAPKVSYGSLY